MTTDEMHEEKRRRLSEIARLLVARSQLDGEIAAMTGRSARPGDVGEFIAAEIFDIELESTANNRGFDGRFRSGLEGTVNVKAYTDTSGGLDIGDHECDYYLVLAGPLRAGKAHTYHRPWGIAEVYLFPRKETRDAVLARGHQSGTSTTIRKAEWAAHQLYPVNRSRLLVVSPQQQELLELLVGGSTDD